MTQPKDYINIHKDRFLNELFDLLKLPSVSADSAFKKDVVATAELVAEQLEKAGCDHVKIYPTAGNPIVYGEKLINPDLPTVLVYGHYDVQPADPVELWDSAPFDPVIKKTELHPEGAIFARGACDDKGQMYMHVKALEFMTKTDQLPCNVKFMIEGEEEVGSKNLGIFVAENKALLNNDIILISDTGMIANDTPSITTGLRGLSYMEVAVTGPNRDLHSGLYGGAVANPINILTQMIASLQDEQNRITIPGFYDDVLELSLEERAAMAEAPFSLEAYCQALNIDDVHGEQGYSTNERNSIRPTLDVNGIWGGYTGEGSKTVIPSQAFAKISMRLVPNQDWEKISALFDRHFKAIAPEGVRVEVTTHHGGQSYVTPIDHPGYRAASAAYQDTFGKAPIPQRSGGSIPIVSLFESELGSKTILMGFGLDSDAIHSPNEHFGVWNYLKGIETIPRFFHHFTEIAKQ
jgi:acetylornithine deacetylase/succinyl-diaminopimelate desuccinylase-like protein